MKTKRFLNLTLTVTLLLTVITSCSDKNVEDIMDLDMDMETNKAPDFVLSSIEGDLVKLADFTGKPVVIFFFGSTCPLCIASAPSIESKINDVFNDSQIGIIGIDTWNGSQSAVERFRASTSTTFDLLLNGSTVQSDYKTTYDRLFVIDKDGNIVHAGTKTASSDVDNVVDVINSLL